MEKSYCCNCLHCKMFRLKTGVLDKYVLRVKCDKGMWKKPNKDEKFYKYFTVDQRIMEECDYYIPMGDLQENLEFLKNNLPLRDEIYEK